MKMYSKSDFMKLPEGTIYTVGKPSFFNGLFVKGKSYDEIDDFQTRNLNSTAEEGEGRFGDWFDRLSSGESLNINNGYGREDAGDPDTLYLVYEVSDMKEIITALELSIINSVKA